MTVEEIHEITVGDTLTPVYSVVKQPNASGVLTVVDLTAATATFKMVNAAGTVIVDWAAATIDSATDGTVHYDFQAADVTTAGEFYGWFRATSSGETDTFPCNGRKFRIDIYAAG